MKKVNDFEPESPQRQLLEFMEYLSEDKWFAGWMSGLEDMLWSAVTTGNQFDCLEPDEINELRRLHAEAGGWWIWHDHNDFTEESRTFLTTAEWTKDPVDVLIEAVSP